MKILFLSAGYREHCAGSWTTVVQMVKQRIKIGFANSELRGPFSGQSVRIEFSKFI